MGFILWQAVHQKAKNSTNCGLPAARLTVVGSVGVKSVLTATVGVGSLTGAGGASVGGTVGWVCAEDSVGALVGGAETRLVVGIGPSVGVGRPGAEVADAAHAESKRDNRVVSANIFRILSPFFSESWELELESELFPSCSFVVFVVH
jgi:hypothetical protein